MAGDARDKDTYYRVYCYSIATNQWQQLPPPGHYMGILQVIDGKLTVIGGANNVSNMVTDKVSTYINNVWISYFPNLLRARLGPGVASHSEYVIVAGGKRDNGTIKDDIEVLNITQPTQWMMTSTLLPRPMWAVFPTTADGVLYIVGYTSPRGRSLSAFSLSVEIIVSSLLPTNNEQAKWIELASAPHCDTIAIPNSYPPVVMGGRSIQDVPTSDIAMLDDSSKKWKRVSSLSSPRYSTAIIPIDSNTILVLGGSTGGEDVAGAKAHSITTAEKGRATLKQRAAALPTEDTQCSIQ